MPTIEYIEGNLIELADQDRFGLIAHGCNCFNTMGSGIALHLSRRWPAIRDTDQLTRRGDANKLGTYNLTPVITKLGSPLLIANLYTQYHYGKLPNGVQTHFEYEHFANILRNLNIDPRLPLDAKIGLPMIGSLRAKGDWNLINDIIERELTNHSITIVRFNQGK